MRYVRPFSVAPVLFVSFSVALAAGPQPNTNPTLDPGKTVNPAALSVKITDGTMTPEVLRLPVGQTSRVTFLNTGSKQHNIVVDSASSGQSSMVQAINGHLNLAPGKGTTLYLSPTSASTYLLKCQLHNPPPGLFSEIIGTIEVGRFTPPSPI